MGTLKKDILIGFLVSMIATVAGGFVYLEHVSKVDFY